MADPDKPDPPATPWATSITTVFGALSLQEISAYAAAVSLLTGLMFNVGFFAAISWDLVGILDTGDHISTAIASAPFVAGGLSALVLPFTVGHISQYHGASLREFLVPTNGPPEDGWLRRLLVSAIDALDRAVRTTEKPPSRRITVAVAFGAITFLAVALSILVARAVGMMSSAVAVFSLAFWASIGIATYLASGFHARRTMPSWPQLFAIGLPLVAFLAATTGAERGTQVWTRGRNIVELRTGDSASPYRLLESFGRGVVMRDDAGNVLFAPWSNVDKITVRRSAER